jgi:hypothetical protein
MRVVAPVSRLRTAGVTLEFRSEHRRVSHLVGPFPLDDAAPAPVWAGEARVYVQVEATTQPFDLSGWERFARDAWRRDGQTLLHNACSSGLDVLVRAEGPSLHLTARWRPPPVVRAAARVAPGRARLLTRSTLVHYPALWWASCRGFAPLHASVCELAGRPGAAVLMAGPGGIGKTSTVQIQIERGARATCDNLCVSDGDSAWGVAEPLRVPQAGHILTRGRGPRMPHGRREVPWPDRVAALTPAAVITLRRGELGEPQLRAIDPDEACRSLIAGTYMAGELRRFWPLAASLALGTGLGNPQPPVADVAARLTARLNCFEVVQGPLGTDSLALLPEALLPVGSAR